MTWKNYFEKKENIFQLILTLVFLAAALISLANFLKYVEKRKGVVLPDPLLSLFEPIDLTSLTFGLIYISLLLAIFVLMRNPDKLVLAIQSYIIMVVFRIVAMFLLPLNPPAEIILLNDPLVEFFGTGELLTKDLFFSGHTATLFLLFLVTDKKFIKIVFLICTIAVAVSVILQHVHYTIDVFAAFFFSYTSFKLAELFQVRFRNKNQSLNNESTA